MLYKIKRFTYILYKRYTDDEVSARASHFTYYLLLSLVPFLMLMMTILRYSPITTEGFLEDIYYLIPNSVYNLIVDTVSAMKQDTNFGFIPVSTIIILWIASKGVFVLIKGLNKSYEVEENRSYLQTRGLALLFTLGFIFMIITSLGLLVFGNVIFNVLINFFNLTNPIFYQLNILRFIIMLGSILIIFTFLFKLGPNVKLKTSEVLPGAVFTTFAWAITSFLFSFYVDNFGDFTNMYGSLGNIAILMIWLYISNITIILGGEINAIIKEANE